MSDMISHACINELTLSVVAYGVNKQTGTRHI